MNRMRPHLRRLCACVILVASGSACMPGITLYDSPLRALVYTKVRFTPRSMKVNTVGGGRPLRFGKSCTWSMAYLNFFWFETGGSIQAAAGEAGISKIAAVEKEITTVLGMIFAQECIIVWGE